MGSGTGRFRDREAPGPTHVQLIAPTSNRQSARTHRRDKAACFEARAIALEETLATKKSMPRLLIIGATLTFIASACGGGTATNAPSAGPGGSAAAGGPAPFVPDPALLAAAKAEGTLNVIALPRDWCNYEVPLTGFTTKFGLTLNEITPDAGSGDEIGAIKNNPNGGPAAPDVVDVGIGFGPANKDLFLPYKVKTWDSIAAEDKDPDGAWYADYYGVLSFEVNTDIVKDVPKDWADLLKPGMKVALAGNPTLSNQAIQSVYAAALATSNGGSLDNAQPGLDFFKKLNAAGNFVPTIAKVGTLISGETPIVITWSYLALADQAANASTTPISVVIPATGRFAGKYAQAISKTAPHPNAAKLWEEWLYSDEGQSGWLKGYCTTSRFTDLVARNAIAADVKAKMPDVSGAVFPSASQLDAAKTLITTNWTAVTGVGTFKTPAP
jgi:putative spermidine/putrescine transport system substrate-binding protein